MLKIKKREINKLKKFKQDHRGYAIAALKGHWAATEDENFNESLIDGYGMIRGLLADLMHLCDRKDMPDFEEELKAAKMHHDAELKGELL